MTREESLDVIKKIVKTYPYGKVMYLSEGNIIVILTTIDDFGRLWRDIFKGCYNITWWTEYSTTITRVFSTFCLGKKIVLSVILPSEIIDKVIKESGKLVRSDE